jgi:hypothetical protein
MARGPGGLAFGSAGRAHINFLIGRGALTAFRPDRADGSERVCCR